jgi:hypothetical protein
MAEPGLRSIPTLVGDAVRELRDLVGGEIALFRTELAQGVHRISLGLSLLLVAAVFAIAGLFVGGVFLLLAIGLGLFGRSKTSLSTLEPTRTGRQVKQDAQVLTERIDA